MMTQINLKLKRYRDNI